LSDVTETLQELLERRLRELGRRRGRGESISLREAWQRLPEDAEGRRTPTYETFRRIRQAGHTNINDETANALATMLEVPVARVYTAARIPPRLGRFELPGRADALSPGERSAVLGIVDAILDARVDAMRLLAQAASVEEPVTGDRPDAEAASAIGAVYEAERQGKSGRARGSADDPDVDRSRRVGKT
jgi:hypothetical protein